MGYQGGCTSPDDLCFLNTEQRKECLGARTAYTKNTQTAEAVSVVHPKSMNPCADIKNY